MARMFMRAFLLSVLALAVCAPSASATFADQVMPVYDAADGVTARGTYLRFGPRAAKLYRRLPDARSRSGADVRRSTTMVRRASARARTAPRNCTAAGTS